MLQKFFYKFNVKSLCILSIGMIHEMSSDISPIEINIHCRIKDRLIAAAENDEYLLINAVIDTTIILECRFCNDIGIQRQQPKVWYYQDRYQVESEKEIELSMNRNGSYNKIYITPELSLTIRNFAAINAGIYRCYGTEGQERENKFNYRLEPIFRDQTESYTEEGNVTGWEKFREIHLTPVNTRFAISKMPELLEIRKEGVTLEVISEWSSWSPCNQCIHNRGYRTSKGYCRLKRYMNTTYADTQDSSIARFFQKSPVLPCKSILLQEAFPTISSAIRYLPEFILKETCRNCLSTKKSKKEGKRMVTFKYRKHYVLAEGAHLTVTCPESTTETMVVWKKDAMPIIKAVDISFRKIEIDAFSTLYLSDVSEHEQGNYTCYVGNVNMMQLRIVVVSKTKLLTEAFLRHLGFLGFILLLTLFCYCTSLIFVCRWKHTFDDNIYYGN